MRIARWQFFLGLVLGLFSCVPNEPFYLLKQGKKQIEINLKKRKIDYLLNNQTISEEKKQKFKTLKNLLDFAQRELKLNTKDQFEYYYEVSGKAISFMVVASEKLQLRPKKYWFPFVGTVYYIGFFDLNDAKAYAEYLKNQNWDVRISGISAYSSLGWFKDPIFTYHLEYSEVELARLVFHELTHNTYWNQNDSQFNETLADFVEREGTSLYLIKTQQNEKLKEFHQQLQFEAEHQKLFYDYKIKLQNLYDDQTLTTEQKLTKKQEVLNHIKHDLVSLYKKFKKDNLIENLQKRNFNNADFVLLQIYSHKEKEEKITKIYQDCDKNWECFWKKIKENH